MAIDSRFACSLTCGLTLRWSQQPPRWSVPPSRQFGRAPCAQPSRSAAVAQLGFVRRYRAMSSVRTPQEKKRLAYERDHYAKSEYDKARSGWRTKKHKARRSYRNAADSLAKAAAFDGESDSKISAIRQRRVRRWPVPSLRERVAHKLGRRVRSIGAKKVRRTRRERANKSLQATAAAPCS